MLYHPFNQSFHKIALTHGVRVAHNSTVSFGSGHCDIEATLILQEPNPCGSSAITAPHEAQDNSLSLAALKPIYRSDLQLWSIW
jgi:hypothetical protein